MTPPVLQIRRVSKSFPGVQALEGVDLDIEPGRTHAIMGENGAGKSTLMRILAGHFPPDSGEIVLRGKPVSFQNPHAALRNGIAMIHQELLPFKNLSVAENILIGRERTRWFPGWLDNGTMAEEAGRLLSTLAPGLDPARRMSDLSVAEMQVVEIAKALGQNASVLIMDEPTTAISGREVNALFGVIDGLKSRGVAVVYISHKMDEVFRVADSISVLRDGRHVATRPAGELDEPTLINLMVGRELAARTAERCETGEPVLEVKGLSNPPRFRNISFTLRKGEILGIAGLMGAGRTDLAHALYGLASAASGQVRLRGETVNLRSPRESLAAGIALISEDRKVFGLVPQMSVARNITLSSLRSFILNRGEENRVAGQQIKRLTIRVSDPAQTVGSLSGGNQQKVLIARALLRDPDVLILDEPTKGIDVGAKAEIYALIRELARAGKAVLFISSELPELLLLSHRLLVMRSGELAAELDPGRTTQEEIMRIAMPAAQGPTINKTR